VLEADLAAHWTIHHQHLDNRQARCGCHYGW
jgi:hypothetical protein